MFIRVPVDKISKTKYAKLRAIVDDINSINPQLANVVMYVEDDRPLGIIVYGPNRIYALYVVPEVRGSGVGSKLLALFFQESITPAYAVVEPENNSVITFFLKHNWRIQGKYKTHDGENWCIRMIRTDTPPKPVVTASETALAEFLENTPVFVSVAKSIF